MRPIEVGTKRVHLSWPIGRNVAGDQGRVSRMVSRDLRPLGDSTALLAIHQAANYPVRQGTKGCEPPWFQGANST